MKVAINLNKKCIVDVLPDDVTSDTAYIKNNRYVRYELEDPIKEIITNVDGYPEYVFRELTAQELADINNYYVLTHKKDIVTSSVIDYKGVPYQGDEISQGRMLRVYASLNDGQSVKWITQDNNINELTKNELYELFQLAVNNQVEVWLKGY